MYSDDGDDGDDSIVSDGNDNDVYDVETSHTLLQDYDIDDVVYEGNDKLYNCSTNDVDSAADRVRYTEAVRRKAKRRSVRSSKSRPMIKTAVTFHFILVVCTRWNSYGQAVCDEKKNRLSLKR